MSDAVNCEYCVNYSYDDRYLFEFNIRHDGSSRMPKANRYATFPSSPETSISVHTSRWVTNTALYVSRCRIYKK